MKKATLLFLIIFSCFNWGKAQNVQHISAEQFRELSQSKQGIILDVRTPGEHRRGHIPNSTLINISDKDFVTKINRLQKDKPVYVYCLTGSRSYSAANYMAKIGFKEVYNLGRGIIDWNRNNFPVAKGEKAAPSESQVFSTAQVENILKNNELVLLDFYAPWCAPCKTMAPTIDKISNDFKGKAKVEKVDVESNDPVAQAYGVASIPTLLLFKNGKKVWEHKGTISYEVLADKLKTVSTK